MRSEALCKSTLHCKWTVSAAVWSCRHGKNRDITKTNCPHLQAAICGTMVFNIAVLKWLRPPHELYTLFILHRNSFEQKGLEHLQAVLMGAWNPNEHAQTSLILRLPMKLVLLCGTHPQCCIAGSQPPFATPAIAFQLPVITAKSTQQVESWKGQEKGEDKIP